MKRELSDIEKKQNSTDLRYKKEVIHLLREHEQTIKSLHFEGKQEISEEKFPSFFVVDSDRSADSRLRNRCVSQATKKLDESSKTVVDSVVDDPVEQKPVPAPRTFHPRREQLYTTTQSEDVSNRVVDGIERKKPVPAPRQSLNIRREQSQHAEDVSTPDQIIGSAVNDQVNDVPNVPEGVPIYFKIKPRNRKWRKYSVFSNLYRYDCVYNGEKFKSNEHALVHSLYMFHNQPRKAAEVFTIDDAEEVRLFGKKLKNRRKEWEDAESRKVLEELNLIKAHRCEKFHKTLVESEGRELRESTNDPVWGYAGGTGCNIMGVILMDLRDRLKLERMMENTVLPIDKEVLLGRESAPVAEHMSESPITNAANDEFQESIEVPEVSELNVNAETFVMKKSQIPKVGILGDSQTHGIHPRIPGSIVLTVPFSGAKVADLQKMIPEVVDVATSHTALMIGTNDVLTLSPDEFRSQYLDLVCSVEKANPNVQIICVGLFRRFDMGPKNNEVNSRILEFNDIIKEMGHQYVDNTTNAEEYQIYTKKLLHLDLTGQYMLSQSIRFAVLNPDVRFVQTFPNAVLPRSRVSNGSRPNDYESPKTRSRFVDQHRRNPSSKFPTLNRMNNAHQKVQRHVKPQGPARQMLSQNVPKRNDPLQPPGNNAGCVPDVCLNNAPSRMLSQQLPANQSQIAGGVPDVRLNSAPSPMMSQQLPANQRQNAGCVPDVRLNSAPSPMMSQQLPANQCQKVGCAPDVCLNRGPSLMSQQLSAYQHQNEQTRSLPVVNTQQHIPDMPLQFHGTTQQMFQTPTYQVNQGQTQSSVSYDGRQYMTVPGPQNLTIPAQVPQTNYMAAGAQSPLHFPVSRGNQIAVPIFEAHQRNNVTPLYSQVVSGYPQNLGSHHLM